VRCVFDDPWLAADYVLCKERAQAIFEGAVITSRTCRVSRIIYAISYTEKEIGDLFTSLGNKWDIPTSIVWVGSKYPQRNRRELELVLKNYGKKEGLELGSLLFFGPATLAAVYDAVKFRKSAMERYISVGGSAIKHPQVMKVRVGKRIGEVINECGGFTGNPKRIASGSPLMGQPINNLDEPVTKTSYAIFASIEGFGRDNSSSCINCGECRNVCPVGLDPEELYKSTMFAEKNSFQTSIAAGKASECHSCGCCELVCPSRLPLSSAIASFGLDGTHG
jgi:electron transport complex protein RnfC